MRAARFAGWRLLFLLAAPVLLAGGIKHPMGMMATMLADPDWVPAHVLLLAGCVALFAGVIAFGRTAGREPPMRTWVRLAALGALLQCAAMTVHTAGVLDRVNLESGTPTPLLSMHRWLSIIIHPVFGLTMVGLIVAGARQRVLGSVWIAWIGIAGALGLGAANPLGFAGIEWAGRLYFLLAFLVGWLILTALWPDPVMPAPGPRPTG